jgi:hypothetical protein
LLDAPDDFDEDDRRRWDCAEDLNEVIKASLKTLGVHANISMFRLFDVVQRWERDAKRLGSEHADGFHPVKYIAYQAFWIRKLKPVSNAYRIKDLEMGRPSPTREIVDINERLAIRVAVWNLLTFAETGLYPTERGDANAVKTKVKPAVLRDYIKSYLQFPDATVKGQPGKAKGTTYQNLVYNQRYRTFGPHHLVHILDQALFGALRQQAMGKKKGK